MLTSPMMFLALGPDFVDGGFDVGMDTGDDHGQDTEEQSVGKFYDAFVVVFVIGVVPSFDVAVGCDSISTRTGADVYANCIFNEDGNSGIDGELNSRMESFSDGVVDADNYIKGCAIHWKSFHDGIEHRFLLSRMQIVHNMLQYGPCHGIEHEYGYKRQHIFLCEL